ncbi:tyrosine-type recombinase/integrase [Hoeflea sp.]|uniref:tyrosine-type recombinase/integrase n=1 Tax=Hoeflea sp. TaxID=1940281 RepID=UPI003B5262B8
MPRQKKPAHLWLRTTNRVWYIKDGATRVTTGCAEHDVDGAQAALKAYLAAQYQAPGQGRADQITIADTLIVYLQERVDRLKVQDKAKAEIGRLNAFMGHRPVAEIRGRLCREYAKHRGTDAGARRDLETLRAAVRYYHAEYGLSVLPTITLPDKSLPRERWLTRSEVAALLRAARATDKCDHLVRLILIGVYTGTRLSAMLNLQWRPNTMGGWIDMDAGIMHRKAAGERVSHNKRKTPVRIPNRLMRFLRAWKKADQGLPYVVHFRGEPIVKPHKAFRTVRAAAGLGEDVTPHILRHTRGTWLAQAGVPSGQAAASLGMTEAEYERTYLHNDPSFQGAAADAY